MNQLPLSHRNDAATSHAAEAKHRASGKLQGNRARVLALVVRWPGKTCQEYFELCVRNETAALLVGLPMTFYSMRGRPEQAIIAYALLRETIKKRMRDLFELALVQRLRDSEGKWRTRNGALMYWPTHRGVLENGGKS